MPSRRYRISSPIRHCIAASILPLCALLLVVAPDKFPLVNARAFLVPGAVVLVLVGAWLLRKGRSRAGMGALLAALITGMPVVHAGLGKRSGADGSAVLSIAQMNVHEASTSHAQVVGVARSSGADLLSMQEVDEYWWDVLLAGLSEEYPWYIHGAGEKNHGIALFSKVPLDHVEVFDLEGTPAIRAAVRHSGGSMQVITAHLRAPESAAKLEQRNGQWIALAGLVNTAAMPVCLIGDLNTVPWDDAYKQFRSATGMVPGSLATAPTWPVVAGISIVPLDHVLTTPELYPDHMRTFTIPGSDHRGISAQIMAVQ